MSKNTKLIPLLEQTDHLNESEQRELIQFLGSEGVVAVIDEGRLLVSEEGMDEAQQAIDSYYQEKLEYMQAQGSFSSWAIAVWRSIFPG